MKKVGRTYRHRRVRRKVAGRPDRPRLIVFRTKKHIYGQLIDDTSDKVLLGISTLAKEFKGKKLKTSDKEGAKEIGRLIAKKAKELGINQVCFDRAGYAYHGRVKGLAEGAREGGLKL